MTDLLDLAGLIQAEDAGTSNGANLLANPALDVRDPAARNKSTTGHFRSVWTLD